MQQLPSLLSWTTITNKVVLPNDHIEEKKIGKILDLQRTRKDQPKQL